MNLRWKKVMPLLVALFGVLAFAPEVIPAGSNHKLQVTGYYGGWELGNGSNGYLPVSGVDFGGLTEVIHFSLVPRPDGTLDTASNDILSEGSRALIDAAHASGCKVLISIGGWNTAAGFEGATGPKNLTKFVMDVSLFITGRGYDGVDIDWEPLNEADYSRFTRLIKTLRAALGPHYIITIAVGEGSENITASVQQYLNQIHVMTYDLSFPSPGWVTWYNSALHDGGVRFPSSGAPVPSCSAIIESFISAGVPREKIEIGAELGGSVWKGGLTPNGGGVTRPGQSWTTVPSFTPDVPYYTIMKDYYPRAKYHWDRDTQASYLSIDSASSAGDYFISFDDSSDVDAKVKYAEHQQLGGIFLYELGMGYVGDGKIPLLKDINEALRSVDVRNSSSKSYERR